MQGPNKFPKCGAVKVLGGMFIPMYKKFVKSASGIVCRFDVPRRVLGHVPPSIGPGPCPSCAGCLLSGSRTQISALTKHPCYNCA